MFVFGPYGPYRGERVNLLNECWETSTAHTWSKYVATGMLWIPPAYAKNPWTALNADEEVLRKIRTKRKMLPAIRERQLEIWGI